ncbi:MAG: exodeoxyribonuclease VII large subunit, partial [Actinomycetia bacterium]|nr:exodeoxyribonuclease VII large subunit [Actinomycetes bacterium]
PRPGSSADVPASLARVVTLVKDWVERCGWVWVEAQVIELRRRAAPTQFLTLRDTHGTTSATVTCPAAVLDAAGVLTEGMTVLARLHPKVWADRASLSFDCAEIRIAGEGQLLAQLEALRRKLAAEGLFDMRRKRPVPFLPRGIGLITGADSAAERDVVTNVRRRWAQARLVVRHVLVQGPECTAQVMAALAAMDADPTVDVIVIARGGGSLEDLLPFSDEGLVRAVAACRTPVVSAIGHETDTPILDLVADLRASTPTDAAKRVVPDADDERALLAAARAHLLGALETRLAAETRQLTALCSRPVLANPAAALGPHAEAIAAYRLRLRAAIRATIRDERSTVDHARATTRALSPRATLDRGYAIVTSQDRMVTGPADVAAGDPLAIQLAHGRLTATVAPDKPEHSRHGAPKRPSRRKAA